jgi:hypothetical protein
MTPWVCCGHKQPGAQCSHISSHTIIPMRSQCQGQPHKVPQVHERGASTEPPRLNSKTASHPAVTRAKQSTDQ